MERIPQRSLEGAISLSRKPTKEGLERAYDNTVLSRFRRGSEGAPSGDREAIVAHANNRRFFEDMQFGLKSRLGKQLQAVKLFVNIHIKKIQSPIKRRDI